MAVRRTFRLNDGASGRGEVMEISEEGVLNGYVCVDGILHVVVRFERG